MTEHTDEQIQAWADEAEAGYDLDMLRAAPTTYGPGVVDLLPAWIVTAVNLRASREGREPADVVREALTTYLRAS